MLNRYEQPVHEVLAAIKKLRENEVPEILTPFIPVPLLDKTLSLGYKHWLDKRSEGNYGVYFSR